MDKAIWVGSESARRAAMQQQSSVSFAEAQQQFIELKQDSEFWLVFIVCVSIALYIGYRYGEWENAHREGK